MTDYLDAVLAMGLEPARSVEPTEAEIRSILERTQPRRKVRWRRPLAVALAALALGGGAAASLLDRDADIDSRVRNQGPFETAGDPALDRLVAQARTRPGLAPIANTVSIEARASDPSGGDAWVLVVWRTQSAGWCADAARQRGAKVGVRDDRGRLRRFPFHEAGNCTTSSLPPDHAVASVDYHPGGPTVVRGIAGRAVASVRVVGVAGVGELKPSARGGFLAVVAPEIRSPSFGLVLTLRDGTTRRIR